MAQTPKLEHLFLELELPSMYVEDVPALLAEQGLSSGETESDFILNCIGEPSGCKLTTEISGEKDSDVVSVWGMVRAARLGEAGRGYGDGPHLSEDEIEEHWSDRLDGPLEEAVDLAVERMHAEGISDQDIADDLQHQLNMAKIRIRAAAASGEARA